MATPGVWGAEFLVNSVTNNAQFSPVITALTGGRFAVAYTDYSRAVQDGFTDYSVSSVRVEIFESDGSACSSAIQVNTVTSYEQNSPLIAPLADGGFVVTYSDSSTGWNSQGDDVWAEAVRMQRFSAEGDKLGIETLVNTSVLGAQDYSSVALLETGQFIVSWDNGYREVDVDLRAQLFNADGSFSGGEFQLNAMTSGLQTDSEIAALPGGGFVVTWVDTYGRDGDMGTIMARIFAADGTPLGTEFQVNTTATKDQFQPSITALSGGGFFIVWTDDSRGVDTGGDDGMHFAIRGQVFDASGAPVGGEMLVNEVTTNGQYQPHVLALSDGRFIVAFTDTSVGTETDGDDTDIGAIRARIFNADGTAASDEFLVNETTTGHQSEPQMTELPDGRVVFTWTDYSCGVETGGDDADNGAIRARILDMRETAVTWAGGSGADSFTGTGWDDKLIGGGGGDMLNGSDGHDILYGRAGNDRISGGNGNDVLRGDGGRDILSGGLGKDKILGGASDDVLYGNGSADVLKGNNGNDEIVGGFGGDLLYGGPGSDTFVFADARDSKGSASLRDVIADFRDGIDRIDLSAIDANPATAADDAFRFLDHGSFTGTAGEIRYIHNSKRSMIMVDIDGDKRVDMKIELTSWHDLDASDFVL